MIIDFHTHIFPDAMADYAMKKLSASENEEYRAAATASALIENMDKAGIDKSVVLHVATKEHQHEDILKFAKEVDSERLISFGSVIPYSLSALEYVWKISDEGLKGIKLHPPLQRCDADDERIFPVYDLARALNLVVLFHAGWDPSYKDEERCTPAMLLKILRNFPGLKVVAAHLGGMHLAKEVYETLAGKADLYFDTAFTAAPWLDKNLFRSIIRRHGADKILFGSDYPWHLPQMELELIDGLGLSLEEKNLILWENAAALLGL